jgi:phosphatidylserine/phosphatidylglycerophosphate/cardiolipin synthase-like enzyme
MGAGGEGAAPETGTLGERHRKLLELYSQLRRDVAREEERLVRVILTLDNKAQTELRPGIDFDDSLASTLDRMFSSATTILRVAIPYVTLGGFRDFSTMVGHTLKMPCEVKFLFRYPESSDDIRLHELIQKTYEKEIEVRKFRFRFIGERGRSGLHAKVVIRDEEEALVSSANWTGYSLGANAEVGLLTESKRAVHLLARWFDFSYEHATSWMDIERG